MYLCSMSVPMALCTVGVPVYYIGCTCGTVSVNVLMYYECTCVL